MFFIKLGWRNILRNKKRMALAGLAITIGMASLIILNALVAGMNNNMIINATNTYLGHGQIHAKGFKETFESKNTINELPQVLANLKAEKSIESITLRTQSFAMLSSAFNVESVFLFGIDPKTEIDISQTKDLIIKGEFLSNNKQNEIIIGKKLSEILDVEPGDRIVLTVARAASGELSQDLFRVGGIFLFNIRELDSGIAFININKSQELLNIGKNVHEIALKFHKLSTIEDPIIDFWSRYSENDNKALSWKELLPGIDAAMKMSSFFSLFIGMVLLAVVAVVVMNTLFMSLYERMYEFGVLRAIGTRPLSMALMILSEAGVLAVISIIFGLILGIAISYLTSVTGIDYVGLEMGNVTFREPIRPVLIMGHLTLFPVYVFIFTMVAAIVPAIHAAKLTPAETMKKD